MLPRKSFAFLLAGLMLTATGCCLDVNGDGFVNEDDLMALFTGGTPDEGTDGGTGNSGTGDEGAGDQGTGDEGTEPTMPPN
jgi:hypothetical protein